MGCGASAGVHAADTAGNMYSISEHDKRIVKRTWNKMSNNMSGIGTKVFLRIFTNHPHVKQLFPFRDLSDDALLQNATFKGHASRFMQSVGAAVDNIDDLDAQMAPLLFGIGQEHINYKGFTMDYFDLFTEAILQIFEQELKTKYTSEVAGVWTRLFEYMITKLKEGYKDAAKIQQMNENASLRETTLHIAEE